MRKSFAVFVVLFSIVAQSQTRDEKSSGDAIALLEKVRNAKDNNDPEKAFQSFRFDAYNKLLVTANADSIRGTIDTIIVKRFFGRRKKIDSTQYKIKRIANRQHFFAAEKASYYEFDGRRFKETVTGTRMSGFREPLYEVFGLQLQSFSLYEDLYELVETRYVNPISRDGQRLYSFRITDTLFIEGRSVSALSFYGRKKGRPDGVLFIDNENYGIARATFNVSGVLRTEASHDFTFDPTRNIWIPSGRSFVLSKGTSDEDVRILGETIKFAANDFDGAKRAKQASDFTYLISQTSFSNFQYDLPITIRRTAVNVEVRNNAANRNEDFWLTFRPAPNPREQNTYTANDSIVARERIEKKLRFGRKIINGYVPFGPVDLDLRHVLSYNNYEGFRIGIGGTTNDRFSAKYRIEGYTAYGTKDGNFKYNIGAATRIGQFSNTWIGGSYTDDVREIASTSFATDKRVFRLYDPRPFNVSTFYSYQTERIFLETRIIPKTESIWQLSRNLIVPEFSYIFNPDGQMYDQFRLTLATVSLQWNPFSEFMQTPAGRFETEKRFPKFALQFTQALPEILEGSFAFSKIDLRMEYEHKFLNGQKSSVIFQAGLASGDVPLTHLYSTSPNNLNRDALLQRITFAGKNSFETMYFNEFFSSRFASMQLKHGFKRISLFRKVRPAPVFVTRMALGTMENETRHIGIDYKTLEKGYFESGIELNKIYKGLGISGFYRYGPYGLPRFEDNLSIKVSFILNIGI